MINCKPISNPLGQKNHLTLKTNDEEIKFKALGINYHSSIESINYFSTATHTDLSFSVSSLSQLLERPGIQNLKAFLHVLWYLKGTEDVDILFQRQQTSGISSYTNTYWGNYHESCFSVTGFLEIFNGLLVPWKTHKQPTISLSTSEEEKFSL
ncbi:hypothetical protein O181_038957 [Austropuccinia psidii MF-1]|uniref:Uncharacterized protein n=1 Tax=Austropuccinia psidii MF-1 TaxID=1389203 RepID=A0A9Q3HCE7_9BASI|nr:hypothetical protein [Austropuccinia psidii MF-1]